jgi:hypothetical protein
MDGAGYHEPYRCCETSSDPVSEDEEGAAYISIGSSEELRDFARIGVNPLVDCRTMCSGRLNE